jgi:type I restriction-modification system DNA methylase subunit
MGNERKTEGIVRDILKSNKTKYGGGVIIEEQKSDNPRIAKLLKHASKGGNADGKPEFVVSFPNKDLLIVIECKANVKNHKSVTLDKPTEYAVDGALLYSSYLSKEFDVFALGVSGENIEELQIDTYLQTIGEKSARDLGIKKVYEFGDYIDLFRKDAVKEKANFQKLMDYSKTLNQKLRDDFEFEETYRPLIVSAILLALEDKSFCSAYQKKQKPIEVANLLLTTVKERLEHDNIGEMKKNTMVQTYGFMTTATKIINETNKDGTPNTHLANLIREIEDNVTPFLQDYRQYDVMGEFYKEFLRYANGDGGLGIVLTPHHITELFTDIAQVNKDSVVIDNCCGTGGFLISAMKRMEDEAKGDSTKIKAIHKKQLIGIDDNSKMFCLACSNMMLRGDGKSNIYQQDCFQIDEAEIKKFKPTVGFLNPPYSKKNGHKELRFVDNCLGFLEPNGICIAIIPQSCAMNTKKGNLLVKQSLLEKHTLIAVMSMPNTLFEDSDKNTVTCVLVFEAFRPHKNSKTWFGYWKDDGFIKVRPYGRTDYYGRYYNEIKKYWLDSYFSKKEIEGFSILREVNATDEWLVEPYIKTQFEKLTDADFIHTLMEYTTFLYYNQLLDRVSSERFSDEILTLDFGNWKPVKIGTLFNVAGAKKTNKRILDEAHTTAEGRYPYVTTQSTNNGVRGFYDSYRNKGNVLTIDSAVIGFCSYQSFNFLASDHVEVLSPIDFELNVFRAMFLVTVINMEQYRYSYGRKFHQDRIRDTIIKLPFKDEHVDWEYIENYIKGLKYSKHLLS